MSSLLVVVLTSAAALVAALAALHVWTLARPHEVRTEIEVDASPRRVWEVLTRFDAYPDWNPFIVSVRGRAETGATLINQLSIGGRTTGFSPTVLSASPGRELRWLGRVLVPGIVDGEHYFVIEDLGDGRSRLVHGETFTGAFVPFAGKALDVADEFAAMNSALKERAERMVT
ncbi:hypothetical protein SAMN05421505_13643 [Sinosporangium album]|uniref:Polyketide cyclase / dehydrase and lipid transport n=1 Tax=Sinosporangium album TaxID=504805 RepID=A0A1G8ICY4_9ACTN|nr:SRPBCC domain-containing protein [Sinosporangium album]SDI16420.1 hypothetical protein SAMN05421505_13643 [Sinosporangium album]